MFLTRWKMMAGLLAVSLGGLAAMAGPCTKDDKVPRRPTCGFGARINASDATPGRPSLPPIPAPESTKAPAVPPMLPVIRRGERLGRPGSDGGPCCASSSIPAGSTAPVENSPCRRS